MYEVIGTMASLIEISTFVHSSRRWMRHRIQDWKVPSSIGMTDNEFRFSAEYYSLTTDAGFWRRLKLGRESFREAKRLLHDRAKLIQSYPGLARKSLTDERVGQMPFEVITHKTEGAKLEIRETQYRVCSALLHIYDATHSSLIEHCRCAGIQYEPTSLVRACDWRKGTLAVERTEYIEAASTNLIADIDMQGALKKTTLLENSFGTSNTIREYDLSLSDRAGCYPSLKKSSLANPIGVAGIAVTADNRLILIHRSRGVSAYAFKLGPSSSGYVTWHDLQSKRPHSLNSLLVTGLQREIAEELHLDLSRDITGLHSLGFFREFYRAGMPQAFYCFRINLTAEDVVSRMRDAQDFRECIGVLSVPVNRRGISRIIATLVRAQRVGALEIGLEAQALLTALARNGRDFLSR